MARIARAFAHRERLYDAPFYRLIHAEADGLPGVIVDRFGDTAVIQPNAAWAERWRATCRGAGRGAGVANVVKNASGRARGLEGLDDLSAVLVGRNPGKVEVPMNGALHRRSRGRAEDRAVLRPAPEPRFAAGLAKDARVLDVFAHVGGFALAALAGGAAQTLAVDASAPALALAAEGAAASGSADRFDTRQGDAFEVLEALAAEGARFELVICDPPAFAPSKPALEAGLRAYEKLARLAAPLVAEGGYLGLCSCSHAADLAKFRTSCTRGIGRGGRQAQLIHTGFAGPDHPQHPQLAETGYLKALFYRMLG
ncbi:MAG: class I SAM-dependent methyltransferase [Paracoccaceae bacterium]